MRRGAAAAGSNDRSGGFDWPCANTATVVEQNAIIPARARCALIISPEHRVNDAALHAVARVSRDLKKALERNASARLGKCVELGASNIEKVCGASEQTADASSAK